MDGKSSARERVTIREMAQRLGVSVASVSYALNGRPGVGEATRERVLALAQELEWRPSSSARALSRARTDTVGMVLRRDPELLGQEPFYMSLLSGVEHVLSEEGQSLMLRMVGMQPGRDLEVYRKWSAERRVDGVIVLDRLVEDPRPELLRALGMPFIMHGQSIDPETGREITEDLVTATDARRIVDHLAELGHVDVVDLAGPLTLAHEVERRDAIRARAAECGIRVTVIEGDYTREGAARLVAEHQSEWPDATAVISSNDVMALGVLHSLRDAGRTGMALISWDDSLLCEIAVPSITSLARQTDAQGRRSARMLLRAIAGDMTAAEAIIPGELMVRETSIAR